MDKPFASERPGDRFNLVMIVVVLAFLYIVIGLSIPRLKSAKISPAMVVLAIIPLLGPLALFAIAREKA